MRVIDSAAAAAAATAAHWSARRRFLASAANASKLIDVIASCTFASLRFRAVLSPLLFGRLFGSKRLQRTLSASDALSRIVVQRPHQRLPAVHCSNLLESHKRDELLRAQKRTSATEANELGSDGFFSTRLRNFGVFSSASLDARDSVAMMTRK